MRAPSSICDSFPSLTNVALRVLPAYRSVLMWLPSPLLEKPDAPQLMTFVVAPVSLPRSTSSVIGLFPSSTNPLLVSPVIRFHDVPTMPPTTWPGVLVLLSSTVAPKLRLTDIAPADAANAATRHRPAKRCAIYMKHPSIVPFRSWHHFGDGRGDALDNAKLPPNPGQSHSHGPMSLSR